jgi:hypothetical protein
VNDRNSPCHLGQLRPIGLLLGVEIRNASIERRKGERWIVRTHPRQGAGPAE